MIHGDLETFQCILEYQPPDTRDDIYSLAILIYEMLSGRRPFGDRNAVQARDAGEKPLPIASLSYRQNAALTQGLAFDRASRTETVEALLAGFTPKPNSGKSRSALLKSNWLAGVIVLIVAALAYLVADKFWLADHLKAQQARTSPANIVNDKSIAVLPFTDMSEKKDQESAGVAAGMRAR